MKSFARMTKLPDIGGRSEYMHDPGRQEEIVIESAPVDWSEYQRFEIENQKSQDKNNQGRELIIALPNDWYHSLGKAELYARVERIIAEVFKEKAKEGKVPELDWAVHWNKARTNLHIHVAFSERQRDENPGRWDRDIYHTADGKVARSKAERAKNPDGSFKPPVHRKGDLKGGFTTKDTRYKSKGWLQNTKTILVALYQSKWNVKFDKKGYIAEHHQGKGAEAETIAKKNVVTRENNRRLDFLESQGKNISHLIKRMKDIREEHKIPLLWQNNRGQIQVIAFADIDRAIREMNNSMGRFEKQATPTRAVQKPETPAPAEPAHIEEIVSVPVEPVPEQPAEQSKNVSEPLTEANKESVSPATVEAPKQPVKEPEAERERFCVPEPNTASERLQKALNDFKAAKAECDSARADLAAANKLPFWNKTKKAKKSLAITRIEEAKKDLKDAFSRIEEHGVSTFTYSNGYYSKIDPLIIDSFEMKELTEHVGERIAVLQKEEMAQDLRSRMTMGELRPEINRNRQLANEHHAEKPHEHQQKRKSDWER